MVFSLINLDVLDLWFHFSNLSWANFGSLSFTILLINNLSQNFLNLLSKFGPHISSSCLKSSNGFWRVIVHREVWNNLCSDIIVLEISDGVSCPVIGWVSIKVHHEIWIHSDSCCGSEFLSYHWVECNLAGSKRNYSGLFVTIHLSGEFESVERWVVTDSSSIDL